MGDDNEFKNRENCRDKIQYRTKAYARLKAKKYLKKYGEKSRVYKCTNCKKYHLTKQMIKQYKDGICRIV